MKRERRMLTALGLVGSVLVGVVLFFIGGNGGDPIPTCDGETATIVGVAPGTRGDYQEWIDQGVDVQDHPPGLIRGTTGRDVLVGLVATADRELGTGNGFYAGGTASIGPANQNRQGDLMCAYGDGFDIFYGGRGADVIYKLGEGEAHAYLGGCTSSGEGAACDEYYGGSGVDKVWGFRVPAGKTQIIDSGDGWDHNYIGLGQGRVIVDGGPCSYPGDSDCSERPGGGDHVHPCPGTDLVGRRMTITNIEYVGPSRPFGDINNPCAYNG